jgi:hypothetical protein
MGADKTETRNQTGIQTLTDLGRLAGEEDDVIEDMIEIVRGYMA